MDDAVEEKNSITPEKNIKINNIGETVASKILNTIIKNAIICEDIKTIYSKINNYCFNFTENCFNNFLSEMFIPNENGLDDEEISKDEIFFQDSKINIKNSWIEIMEPDAGIKDTYCNSNINLLQFNPPDNGNKNECLILSNSKKNLHKKLSSLSQENLQYSVKKNDSIVEFPSNEENLDKKNEKLKISNLKSNKDTSKEIKKNLFNEISNNINKEDDTNIDNNIDNNPNIDLPAYDLVKEKYENEYMKISNSEEYNKLRKERQNEIDKKAENKIKEEAKAKEEHFKKLQQRIIKEFDSNKLTFDSNGKIITLKPFNIDSLNGDFILSKPVVKENKNFKNEEIEKKDNRSLLKKKSKKILQKEKPIEKNPKDDPNYLNKYDKLRDDQKKKEFIPPSGNNFNTLIPNIGVVLTSNDNRKKKNGGLEFFKMFNRPSMDDFNKIILSTNNINSQIYSNNNLSHFEVNNSENSQDYIGYKEEFRDNNNPLIQGATPLKTEGNDLDDRVPKTEINKKHIRFINECSKKSRFETIDSERDAKRKKLLKSFDAVKNTNSINSDINKFNNIQLSKKFDRPNLKIYFDGLNEDYNYDNNDNILSNCYSGKNIFNNKRNIFIGGDLNIMKNINSYKKNKDINKKITFLTDINSNNLIDKKEINKFNLNILKSRNWGENELETHENNNKIILGNSFRNRKIYNKFKFTGESIITNMNKQRMRIKPSLQIEYNSLIHKNNEF